MDKPISEWQPTLANELLLLRPLSDGDFEDLYMVAADPLLWEQHPAKDRCQRSVFELFFKDAMASGGALAVIDKKGGQIIGSTRFHLVKESKNAIEIGWTFLAREYWGGVFNRSMKQLMIDWAFQFVTDVLFYIDENNIRSQKAVEKIGGERVSSLNGTPLDLRPNASVIYNITKNKWEELRAIVN